MHFRFSPTTSARSSLEEEAVDVKECLSQPGSTINSPTKSSYARRPKKMSPTTPIFPIHPLVPSNSPISHSKLFVVSSDGVISHHASVNSISSPPAAYIPRRNMGSHLPLQWDLHDPTCLGLISLPTQKGGGFSTARK